MLSNAACAATSWGPIISDGESRVLWKFDKRNFRGGEGTTSVFTVLEEQPLPPVWDPTRSMKLQAGEIVTEEGLALMRQMVETFNEAVRSLPRLPEGMADMDAVVRARGGR